LHYSQERDGSDWERGHPVRSLWFGDVPPPLLRALPMPRSLHSSFKIMPATFILDGDQKSPLSNEKLSVIL
jgi:hypothetical protein